MKNTIIVQSSTMWDNQAVNAATKRILKTLKMVKGSIYEVKNRTINITV